MHTKSKIFLLDDDELIVSMLARALRGEGYEVHPEVDPKGVLKKIKSFNPAVILLDIKMPGCNGLDLLTEIVGQDKTRQVVMLTSDDTAETAVQAMKLGAVDYLTKPFNLEEVKIVIGNVIEKVSLQQEVHYLRQVRTELVETDLIGTSPAIQDLMLRARKLAAARVPLILFTGESGTGKERLARYTHDLAFKDEAPRQAPFIGINCAALPETLIEAELFGHERGAYTDAKTLKKGIFEQADGGSVLLDEIGETRPFLQSKLLRVLEERQVRRIGGGHDIEIDVMIFVTTNRDLEKAVGEGDFRVDLFYRLNAFALHLPPMRERKEDILLLARHFLEHFSERYQRKGLHDFSPEAERLLLAHPWPGNVREIKNVIERIVVLETGELVLPEHLPKEILEGHSEESRGLNHRVPLPEAGLSLEDVAKDLIIQALQRVGGNKALAAKLLNMSYDSLRYQVKKFGLE
jgi:DNA-binding NtrC family response regulator